MDGEVAGIAKLPRCLYFLPFQSLGRRLVADAPNLGYDWRARDAREGAEICSDNASDIFVFEERQEPWDVPGRGEGVGLRFQDLGLVATFIKPKIMLAPQNNVRRFIV
ncbi:hypothetical protein ABC955_05725 [Citromicrobium bathyomarinum]|mgnify:FL=1|uniref:hypothetical protein n=1 Tax=unclassified Citromicrobium TaxID=2630544 RepID=UPI000B1A9772|nr:MULTISPECIES: hypothetical protein [unclassified Citromicrobium]|tara:strand:- start:378 stop:701 length:324 start_codon:yes stop_codon:yes gene_type:complete